MAARSLTNYPCGNSSQDESRRRSAALEDARSTDPGWLAKARRDGTETHAGQVTAAHRWHPPVWPRHPCPASNAPSHQRPSAHCGVESLAAAAIGGHEGGVAAGSCSSGPARGRHIRRRSPVPAERRVAHSETLALTTNTGARELSPHPASARCSDRTDGRVNGRCEKIGDWAYSPDYDD